MSNEKTSDDLNKLRHSTTHVMAQAVQELFPGTKITIGPPIDDGFYYDFESPHPFTPDDLPKIEARMKEIVDGESCLCDEHPLLRRIQSLLGAKGENTKWS
jgi:threonyl-tRNA synthetase